MPPAPPETYPVYMPRAVSEIAMVKAAKYSQAVTAVIAKEDAHLWACLRENPRFIDRLERYGVKPGWTNYDYIEDAPRQRVSITTIQVDTPIIDGLTGETIGENADLYHGSWFKKTLTVERRHYRDFDFDRKNPADNYDAKFTDAEPIGQDAKIFDIDYAEDGEAGIGVGNHIAGLTGLDRLIFEDAHNGSGNLQRQAIWLPLEQEKTDATELAERLKIRRCKAVELLAAFKVLDTEGTTHWELESYIRKGRATVECYIDLAAQIETPNAPEATPTVKEIAANGHFDYFYGDQGNFVYQGATGMHPRDIKATLDCIAIHDAIETELDAAWVDPEAPVIDIEWDDFEAFGQARPVTATRWPIGFNLAAVKDDYADFQDAAITCEYWLDFYGAERRDSYTKDAKQFAYVTIGNDEGKPLTTAEYKAHLAEYYFQIERVDAANLATINAMRRDAGTGSIDFMTGKQRSRFWLLLDFKKAILEEIKRSWLAKLEASLTAAERSTLTKIQSCQSEAQARYYWRLITQALDGKANLGRKAVVEHLFKSACRDAFDKFGKGGTNASRHKDFDRHQVAAIKRNAHYQDKAA